MHHNYGGPTRKFLTTLVIETEYDPSEQGHELGNVQLVMDISNSNTTKLISRVTKETTTNQEEKAANE